MLYFECPFFSRFQYHPEVDSPKGSYYMRVFGKEIRYADFHGFDASTIKEKLNYLEWLLELARERSVEVSRSVVLLDSAASVATAAGLPLRLSVVSTAVMDIHVTGKLDIRNLAAAPRSLHVQGTVKPRYTAAQYTLFSSLLLIINIPDMKGGSVPLYVIIVTQWIVFNCHYIETVFHMTEE